MRLSGVKKRMYRLTYDKPGVNRTALRLRQSFDEVRRLVGENEKKKEPD